MTENRNRAHHRGFTANSKPLRTFPRKQGLETTKSERNHGRSTLRNPGTIKPGDTIRPGTRHPGGALAGTEHRLAVAFSAAPTSTLAIVKLRPNIAHMPKRIPPFDDAFNRVLRAWLAYDGQKTVGARYRRNSRNARRDRAPTEVAVNSRCDLCRSANKIGGSRAYWLQYQSAVPQTPQSFPVPIASSVRLPL